MGGKRGETTWKVLPKIGKGIVFSLKRYIPKKKKE